MPECLLRDTTPSRPGPSKPRPQAQPRPSLLLLQSFALRTLPCCEVVSTWQDAVRPWPALLFDRGRSGSSFPGKAPTL